jgi:hypothetical protein
MSRPSSSPRGSTGTGAPRRAESSITMKQARLSTLVQTQPPRTPAPSAAYALGPWTYRRGWLRPRRSGGAEEFRC